MKATGIVRDIDKVGRVVIPKETRRELGIGPKTPLEIYIEDESIIFRKYTRPENTNDVKEPGIVRDIDAVGRVVIPKEVRNRMGIGPDSHLEIYIDEDMIIFRKYEPACCFCDHAGDLVTYMGRKICRGCIKKLNNLL